MIKQPLAVALFDYELAPILAAAKDQRDRLHRKGFYEASADLGSLIQTLEGRVEQAVAEAND